VPAVVPETRKPRKPETPETRATPVGAARQHDRMTRAPQLPEGTQVVLRADRGATGRVVGTTADGRYQVRLADGRELAVARDGLSLRRAHQQARAIGTGDPDDGARLVREHTIYAAVVGSRAFGLAVDGSDTDLRGVYAAPAADFWSLIKPPAHVEGPARDQFSWEVERFCELALKANPNLLEVLHSPLVHTITPLGQELVGLRRAFLSQLAYQTFSGYVRSQFSKIEADLRRSGAPKWKHVMHLIRLLLAAETLLRTGELVLDAGPHRDRLLAVRGGEVAWADVEAWRLELHRRMDDALEVTALPAVPDVARVDAWLRSVRERSVAAGVSPRAAAPTRGT
jgi:hypothetical protein